MREWERERGGCGFNKLTNSSSKLCCLPWEESALNKTNEYIYIYREREREGGGERELFSMSSRGLLNLLANANQI